MAPRSSVGSSSDACRRKFAEPAPTSSGFAAIPVCLSGQAWTEATPPLVNSGSSFTDFGRIPTPVWSKARIRPNWCRGRDRPGCGQSWLASVPNRIVAKSPRPRGEVGELAAKSARTGPEIAIVMRHQPCRVEAASAINSGPYPADPSMLCSGHLPRRRSEDVTPNHEAMLQPAVYSTREPADLGGVQPRAVWPWRNRPKVWRRRPHTTLAQANAGADDALRKDT